VLYFKTNEEEIDFADDDVFKMVPIENFRKGPQGGGGKEREKRYFDLEYSNSMCRQSSMPTSILIELFDSKGGLYEYTHKSFSRMTSAIRLETVTRIK